RTPAAAAVQPAAFLVQSLEKHGLLGPGHVRRLLSPALGVDPRECRVRPGGGSWRVPCRRWWRGATRAPSRETAGVPGARRVGARAALAVSADGVRGDATLLRALPSGVAARARGPRGRLARRSRQLPAGELGRRAAQARGALDREGRALEHRGVPACP